MAKHFKPQYDDDEIDEDELQFYLEKDQPQDISDDDDDDFGKISFGALKSAQDKLDQEDKAKKIKNRPVQLKKKEVSKQQQPIATKNTRYDDSEEDEVESGSESEGLFEEENIMGYGHNERRGGSSRENKKKSKHAPTEASSKKPVSKIRQIPGLDNPKYKTLYKDIRFDAALGKADLAKVRKDYKFLDDYRQNEVNQIESMLKNPKVKNKMHDREIQDLEYQAKSLKSRLDSLKNKDLEQDVLRKYKDQNKGANGNKFYLKKSEQRKIIQKHKFDNMKASQRDKVMERKRKRRLGKEFKQLEFNRPRN